MKNILITGGAGFIGSALSNALIKNGYNITVLDNLLPQIHGDNPEKSYLYLSIKDKVTFIKGTVTVAADWIKSLRGQDAVIHLAAETGTGQSMYEIQRYTEVNIGGTALMLDILANTQHSIRKIIVASSRAIYGEGKYWSEELGLVYPEHRQDKDMSMGDFEVKYPGVTSLKLCATDEKSKIHPSSVYGITKQNQEQMVMCVAPTLGIDAVAFRYQNVYGPGQSLTNPYTGILSIFSTLIKNGKEINIFEDGKESRDFVFIDDVVSATILGLEQIEANGHVFNVGTGEATDVITVSYELMKNYATKTNVIITGNYRLGDIRHNFADLTKIKDLLGFIPQYNFEKGIRKFTEWVSNQEVVKSEYDKSLLEMRSKGLLK